MPTLDLHKGAVTQDQIDQAEEIKRKMAQDKKHYYDKSAKPLPRLKMGEKVRIYNNKTNCWDMVGNVVYLDKNVIVAIGFTFLVMMCTYGVIVGI